MIPPTRTPPSDPKHAQIPPPLARELAKYIRATVHAEVRGARADDLDPWVPHLRWPCASRRTACDLARSGQLEDVKRVGRGRGTLYLVRASALDAWVEREHARAVDASGEEQDEYEQEMSKRGLRRGAAPEQARAPKAGGVRRLSRRRKTAP